MVTTIFLSKRNNRCLFMKKSGQNKFDLHMHTLYSNHWFWGRDALNTPQEMVKAAVKKGLAGLAITDHSTIKGSIVAKNYAKRFKNFVVITGAEISTASGDLLGLGIKENVSDGLPLEETIEKIHDSGGIAVAPHPFAEYIFRKCLRAKAVKADAVEVLNSQSCRRFQDRKAFALAKKFSLPISAGSDAHWYRNIGRAGIICNAWNSDNVIEELLKKRAKIFGEYTPYYNLAVLTAKKIIRSVKDRIK